MPKNYSALLFLGNLISLVTIIDLDLRIEFCKVFHGFLFKGMYNTILLILENAHKKCAHSKNGATVLTPHATKCPGLHTYINYPIYVCAALGLCI